SREIANRQYEGSALNNLAVNYNTFGEYETGIFYLNQALEIQRETGNRRGEAINLNNLGMSNYLLGNMPKAKEFFEKSLVIRRETKDQKGEGNILSNLGMVAEQSSEYAKAIEYFDQSLTLRRATSDKTGEATTLRGLGKTLWLSGDKLKAAETFEQANILARNIGDRRVEADTFYWLAIVEKQRENLPKAFENIENGLQIIEQIRGEIVNPELRASYFSTVQQFYEFYTELLVSRYEKSNDERDIALALEMSERARTRSLTELLQEARINFRQNVDEKSLEKAQELQDALNAKYRQRTQILSGKPTEEQIAKVTNEINSLKTELENLQIKIRRENPRYADLTQGTSISAKEIQALLDDETVLLEYKLGEKRSFLWLVTKDSIEIFTIPSRKVIESTAKDFYTSIISRDKTKETRTAELSEKLSNTLFGLVEKEIQNKRLAIVADGVLQYIPFASLQISNSKSKISNLIETNEIVVLPSASVLAELRRNSVT
ncbi:MAG TPA: tetratricopeptide repeat protein, partial [Pyrinomonadaceae bacterium]|nr:tetratricopeptide repeat protein [Pyrinomonadaceae bacterium]